MIAVWQGAGSGRTLRALVQEQVGPSPEGSPPGTKGLERSRASADPQLGTSGELLSFFEAQLPPL